MNDDLHGLSGAYAVDAVDDAERSRFEAHLSGCAECRDEVASLRAAGGELAAVAEVAPPPSLKAAVMRDIASVRPLTPLLLEHDRTPAAGRDAGPPTAGQPMADEAAAPTVSSLDLQRASRHRADIGRRSVRPWLAGVAAAAVLAVGVIWQPWDTSEPRQPSMIEQVLQASDAQRFPKTVGSATATVVRSASAHGAVILTENMPPAPAGRVYQLWLQQPDGSMAKAGFMPTGNQRDATVLLDGDAAVAVGAGITVEPAGGSPQPTTAPLVLFTFA